MLKTQPIELFIGYDPLPFLAPSQEIFGGLIRTIQHMNILPIVCSLFACLFFVILLQKKFSERFFTFLSLSLISLTSIIMSFKVCEGFDELFINLRHSFVLRDAGYFSFNFGSMQEGTVDFLPLYLTGLLGKIGFPLVETLISITLLGSILLIIVSWLIAKSLTRNNTYAIITALCVGTLPCVVYVSATGFTATLYTAIILYIGHCVFIANKPKTKTALILASLLTLIRIEGIAIALLLWIYLFIIKDFKNYKENCKDQILRALGGGIFLSAPFFLSLIIRYISFGYPVPIPVIYKNGQGNISYLILGLKQFFWTFFHHNLVLYFSMSLYPAYLIFKKGLLNKNMFWLLGITFISSLMYTTGGGDWFPLYWGRYYMPFIVTLVILALSTCFYALKIFVKGNLTRFFTIIAMLLLPFIVGYFGNPTRPIKSYHHINAYKKIVIDLRQDRNRWQRVDELGLAGKFLHLTTPKNISIASAELATTMYYANRNIVGLLGTTNPDVALSPINPQHRNNPDSVHRRRAPQTLIKNRAEIVAFGQIGVFHMREQKETYQEEVPALTKDFLHLQNAPLFTMTTYYRAGSFDYLRKLGYKYFIVSTPKIYFSYMVHESIQEEHRQMLKKLNIHKAADSNLDYTLPEEFTNHFPSGEEYL